MNHKTMSQEPFLLRTQATSVARRYNFQADSPHNTLRFLLLLFSDMQMKLISFNIK